MLKDIIEELDSLGLSGEVLDDLLSEDGAHVRPIEDTNKIQELSHGPVILPSESSVPETPPAATPLALFRSQESAAAHWINKIPRKPRRRDQKRRASTHSLHLTPHNTPGTFFLKPRGHSRITDSPFQELDELHEQDKCMGLINLPPLVLPEYDSPKTMSPSSDRSTKKDWKSRRTVFHDSPENSMSPSVMRGGGKWIEGDDGRRVRARYQVLDDGDGFQSHLVLYVQSPDWSNTQSTMSSPMSAERVDSPPDITQIEITPRENSLDQETIRETPMGFHTRRVIVPLEADKRFFSALGNAVNNLVQAQLIQQAALVKHVEALGSTIKIIASPQNSPADMYLWRELFSLWLEHEIFESTREIDRGELSVAETEQRLYHFVRELHKRRYLVFQNAISSEQLGKLDQWTVRTRSPTNPFRDERSSATLEHFLRLNVALLALKRFQRASIEAVRKILKKHQKQTSLHAHFNVSRFFPNQEMVNALVQRTEHGGYESTISQLSQQIQPSSYISLLSLPRILASMLTERLIPVLPSVDDFSCPICMAIAWQPIRLDCSHLFCIRCLVKLQKQGSPDCPVCRAPGAVESADKRNLDNDMMNHLLKWFPNEVDDKTLSNREERALEEKKEKVYIRKRRFNRLLRREQPEWRSQHDDERTERERQCVIC